LSGGQQQRAAIARSLSNDPSVIVGDEPTGNLDTKTANDVFEMFENLVDRGKTVILVTHDQTLSARTKRVLHILDGQLDHDERNNSGQDHQAAMLLTTYLQGFEPRRLARAEIG
ncbi:MAG: ATP-binding cassette domain-containing protein, partial [Anaerolineae bacterium]|nr:ATP-binding cassette domain-containing protein [Anaerolineae bacterium]